jgi:hypothetical protein
MLIKKALLTLCSIGLFAGLCLATRPAAAQVRVYIQPPPPPEYIATTDPFYYEGHPVYWYNGYWHYRDDRGAWRYYREEPRFLAERRVRIQPQRRYYYENHGRNFGGREDIRHDRRDDRRDERHDDRDERHDEHRH